MSPLAMPIQICWFRRRGSDSPPQHASGVARLRHAFPGSMRMVRRVDMTHRGWRSLDPHPGWG